MQFNSWERSIIRVSVLTITKTAPRVKKVTFLSSWTQGRVAKWFRYGGTLGDPSTAPCPEKGAILLWPLTNANRFSQEGQHPLTGQRAANFRLLANQWDERRLVKQWRHAAALWGEVCATQVLPMRVGPFAFRYQENGATPCQYIDTTRKAIDCARTLPLTVFLQQPFRPVLSKLPKRRQI